MEQLEMTAPTMQAAISCEARLKELATCDSSTISYDPRRFSIIFRLRGRNLPTIAVPLASLLLWTCAWAAVFRFGEPVRVAMFALDDFFVPMLPAVSFLLVFRLGRAGVRYWDARAAMGKLVEVCRVLSSTAIVSCANHPTLGEDFARWTCVFPIAVKNFLRAGEKPNVSPDERRRQKRVETGMLLSDTEHNEIFNPDGYAPIAVLNRLRQLALQASLELELECQIRGSLFLQLNGHLDTLTGAWGAMERINGTPLPYAYVVHLRTFLMLYLLLWTLHEVAAHGEGGIPLCIAVSWALLGIEAAAVECERPFHWDANHLKLGSMCIVVARNVAQTLRNTA